MLLAKRPSSPLPAAGTNSLAPGHSRLLTVCFVARRYGDRAPGRAAMDIIFAQIKNNYTRRNRHDLAFTSDRGAMALAFTKSTVLFSGLSHQKHTPPGQRSALV